MICNLICDPVCDPICKLKSFQVILGPFRHHSRSFQLILEITRGNFRSFQISPCFSNYLSTFPVIDNFPFLSTYLIFCMLVKYIIPYQTLYHSLLLQSASKQLLYINELIAYHCNPQSFPVTSSLTEQSSTSLFTNMIESGRGIINFESYKNNSFLLQIEAFKYIIQPHSLLQFILTSISSTEIKFVSPAICRLYVNNGQSVPQEHYLLTALLTACF